MFLGLYTGSIYKSSVLLRGGKFPGELYKDGRVLVVKTHKLPFSGDLYDRVVLLLRNPAETILAEFNRKDKKNHTGFASRDSFQKVGNLTATLYMASFRYADLFLDFDLLFWYFS